MDTFDGLDGIEWHVDGVFKVKGLLGRPDVVIENNVKVAVECSSLTIGTNGPFSLLDVSLKGA